MGTWSPLGGLGPWSWDHCTTPKMYVAHLVTGDISTQVLVRFISDTRHVVEVSKPFFPASASLEAGDPEACY